MTYTTLREAGALVRRKEEFTGNNVYGRWHYDGDADLPNQKLTPTGAVPSRYVVYSYGTHFPMYIFDAVTEQWFGNLDKYSSTTSRHQSACHPPNVHVWYDTGMMQKIAMFGFVPTVQARLTTAPSMMSVVRDAAA